MRSLGTGAACNWLSATLLSVRLGFGTTVAPGQMIITLPNVLRSQDLTSPFAPILQARAPAPAAWRAAA